MDPNRWSWIVWSLLSALFAAFTAVLAKLGVAGVSSNLATAIRTTVVLLLTWLIVMFTTGTAPLASISPRNWLFLALSGFGTGASWLCYFRALQLGPASRVAPLDKLSVVFTLALAFLTLGEKISALQLGGAVLICAGAVLLTLA